MTSALLSNFEHDLVIAVVGASGGIGQALVNHLSRQSNVARVLACSRGPAEFAQKNVLAIELNMLCEHSIAAAMENIGKDTQFDIVIVATGLLHAEAVAPEKSLRDLDLNQFQQIFAVNTFGPALLAKYFIPRLKRTDRAVFACLSARVGSIGDNRLGGWYAYRASKTALNMLIKTAAIETARRNKNARIIGLHPGTVDTALSKPFQRQVKEGKLFTAEHSAECLLTVINAVTPNDTGKVFAWDGTEVSA